MNREDVAEQTLCATARLWYDDPFIFGGARMFRRMARAGQFIVRPVRDLVDLTTWLLTSPRTAGRFFGAPEGSALKRAAQYFVAAVSASIIISKVGFSALGIEEIAEIPYWFLHSTIVAGVALFAMALAYPFRSASPSMFLKMALLAYGASFFLTAVIVAGAGLTLAALQWVGYIPQFGHDSVSFDEGAAIGMRVYWDCLRRDHLLARVIFHGLGGAFETLSEPINNLAHVHRLFYVGAAFLFPTLAYFGANRRRAMAGLMALLGSTLVIAAVVIVVGGYRAHLHKTTSCLQEAIDGSAESTVEATLRMIGEQDAKNIGRPIGGNPNILLVNVEVKGRSVIRTVLEKAPSTEPVLLRAFASEKRRNVLRLFCADEPLVTLYRKLRISRVWVTKYADTDFTDTIVLSAEHCVP